MGWENTSVPSFNVSVVLIMMKLDTYGNKNNKYRIYETLV